jgi:hypothetical protein
MREFKENSLVEEFNNLVPEPDPDPDPEPDPNPGDPDD